MCFYIALICLLFIDPVAGCTTISACNYNIAATDDDGSCVTTDGVCETCSGETDGTGTIVDNDADDDGVCDADEGTTSCVSTDAYVICIDIEHVLRHMSISIHRYLICL